MPAPTTRVATDTLAGYTMYVVTIPRVIVGISLSRAALPMWQLLVVVVPWPLLVPRVISTPRVATILVSWVAVHTARTIVPHPCHQVLRCLPGHVVATIGQGFRLELHREAGVGTVLGVGDDGGGGRGERWGGGGDNGAASIVRVDSNSCSPFLGSD